MDKKSLIEKIKSLEGINQDERAYLINLVNIKKKYGLVWEDKPEDAEEQLRNNLPVLREVVKKRILAKDLPKPENTDKTLFDGQMAGELPAPPNHILIEGDNLHALTALTFTHENKIDAIYLDPPYNTGAKDWRYNNDFVVKEDGFRHSKWVSMMYKRLLIAKRLLKYDGIICITIDDYEMPRLFMIMEEIFGEENHLGTIVVRNNPSGRSTLKGVSITHEYGLFFGNSELSQVGRLDRTEKQINRYDLADKISAFEWVNFRKHGGIKDEAPSMFYPIYVTDDSLRIPEIEWDSDKKEWIILEDPRENEKIVYPIDDQGRERRWKWGIDRVKNNPNELCVRNDRKNELGVYMKARMINEGILPLTWWDKKEYSATAYGTNLIKEIFGELQVFAYPKSIHAVKDSLKVLSNKKDAIILDVFAGSGTTLHATIQLNDEDGGQRQCILVTNNENNICEEVTYERNKKIIQGYSNTKGEKILGLTNNNLRYYKSEFVPRDPSLKNKRLLTKLAAELLSIKENCYNDCTSEIIPEKQTWVKFFSDDASHYLCTIYDDDKIEQSVELIQKLLELKRPQEPIKVYVFSNGQYPYTEEFEEVLPNITLCALPDAIYKAYQHVLPAKKRIQVPELEEQIEEGLGQSDGEIVENDLFNQEGSRL